MIAHLFIVSRLEPDLYTYLARELSNEPDVRVIVDRRMGERRAASGANGVPAVERRLGDRRRQAHVAHQLGSIGYAFVRLDT